MMEHRSAHVRIDEQHPLIRLGAGAGQIDCRCRLALFLQGGGDRDHLHGPLRTGKIDVRAQSPIGFRNGRYGIMIHDQRDFIG